jgi:hypothetical protein
MKKIIILIMSLLLVIGFVYAANGTNTEAEKQAKMAKPELYEGGDMPTQINKNAGNDSNKSSPVTTINGTQAHAGLYNALSNVENPQARAALERNMERFLERYQARLQNATIEVEVDEEINQTTIKVKHEVKYLGFIKGKATDKYHIENNGKIDENKPWYRFMYAEQQTEE